MKQVLDAHRLRAREQYNDPNKDTPGDFEEFLENQYVTEYEKENPKQNQNDKVIDRYLDYLASTRDGDNEEIPGLLGKVQGSQKGPYPANSEEDDHLLEQMMKFTHSQNIQKDIVNQMKGAPNELTRTISEITANIAAKLLFEARKVREVNEEVEAAVITILAQDLWTLARNLGMKKIDEAMVSNSIEVAADYFNKLEEQIQTGQMEQPKEVPQLPGQQGGAV